MQFRNKNLDFYNNKVYIMGILNVTPDSFSDGGEYLNLDKAMSHVEKMINDGADIIDIGGESTRPFSDPVSVDEELSRVIPLIEKINENFNTIISIDTYKSQVAEEAVKNGAEIINDISGLTFDPEMENVVSKYHVACCVMHIKGKPNNMQENPVYKNLKGEIYHFLFDKVNQLKNLGIEKIIIDVGFGFGKSLDDNYRLLNKLKKFKSIDCPILAGISRKSMIGKIVNEKPKKRLHGTIALNTIAILNGARIIRVHDVKENYQAAKVIEKYLELKK
jgi:dihydropteroate synthase